MSHFIIRSYTKKELALMYFPDAMPRTAVNHLMTWIYQATDLMEELERTGYRKTSKWFNPRQVELIVNDFGEP